MVYVYNAVTYILLYACGIYIYERTYRYRYIIQYILSTYYIVQEETRERPKCVMRRVGLVCIQILFIHI